MTKYILLATTAFLAACSTTNGEIVSASTAPAATQSDTAAPAAAKSDIDARLAGFFEEYDQMELAHSPMTKAYRGINDADYGKLDDPSDAAAIKEHQRDQAALAEMEAKFDMGQLDETGQLSYRLFQARAERSANAFPFRRNSYIFDQMNGAQSQLPAFMINIHRVVTKADAEAYVSRLAASGPFLDVLIAQAAERADDGIMVPDWVFPYVISDAKNVISGAPFDDGADSPLYADLKKKVNALSISEAEKSDLIARGAQAMTDSMAPAYKKLVAEMERQQKIAVDGDGIWRLDDGAAYYAERLKYYTTTDLNAEEIHQIGLDNVARIHGEMRQIMEKVGFEGSLQDFFKHLRTSDQYYYDTREEYLADANAKLKTMEKALPGYFNTLPEAPWTIKAVEAFREKSAGKAFYQSPAPDGSRPGTYYVNLYDLKSMSKTELEALAYHEALPGHHLQRAIQTELGDLRAFRKFGGFTA